jgi:NAD(P)-dependent dehydrogenase (short-subunit alcohol dehydrogenase family)
MILLSLRRVFGILKVWGKRRHWYQCDLADCDAVNTMFEKMAEDLGSIDILINNAGIIRDACL